MRILRKVIAGSRYILIIAVFGTFVAALTVLLYAGLTVVLLIIAIFARFRFQIEDIAHFQIEGIKHVALTSIELIDLFLISTVLYIFSFALYSLFIDNKLPIPRWLGISNFDDLERRLLGVVVVLLTITFLGFAVDWSPGDYSIAALGIGTGVVLFPIGFVLSKRLLTRVARTNGTDDVAEAEPGIEQDTSETP